MSYAEAFALFPDMSLGQTAADRLRMAGFDEIDLAGPDQVNTPLLPGNAKDNQRKMEGTFATAAVGLLVGALLGMAVGVAFGFSGAAIGAVTGGCAGALIGIFVGVAISNRSEAKYRDYIERGGVRLTVRCPNGSLLEQASQILRDSGASELGVTTSTRSPMSGS
jgi:hypothetical protein